MADEPLITGDTVKKLSGGRIECTVTITQEQFAPAEAKAIQDLGEKVKIEGFRPGKAPVDILKEKVNPDQIFEQAVHNVLPDTFEKLVKDNNISPIIHPMVEVEGRDPLRLKITFVEKPEVKLKGIDKIKIEKIEPKVDDKDIQKMIDYVMGKHQTSTEVDRAAKTDDRITMDFWAADSDEKEIEGIRTTGHQVVIGSKVLIPGFEDELVGTKKGDEKTFTLTFPEKYHAEHLQNKPVTFHVKVTAVEELHTPELTDEFAKKELQAESVEDFKRLITESMMAQEQQMEKQAREQKLMDAVAAATTVELAPELLESEQRDLFQDLQKNLEQQGMTVEDWVNSTGKKAEEIHKDMEEQAIKRITLRLGMQQLVTEKGTTITDDEMTHIVQELLGPIQGEERKKIEPMYKPGERAYDQLKWQKTVEKVIDEMLG